jgi:hypothetical protein
MLDHAQGQPARQKRNALGVFADEDAPLVAFDAGHDDGRGALGREGEHAFDGHPFLHGALGGHVTYLAANAGVPGDVGGDAARMDGAHSDSRVAEFEPERLGKATDGVLARHIGGLSWRREEPEYAGDVDDVRLTLPQERRQERLAAVDDAPEVDAHQPMKVLDAEVLEGTPERDAGIVDEELDTPVRGQRVCGVALDGSKVADVAHMPGHRVGSRRTRQIRRLFERLAPDIGEGQGAAPLRQGERERAADAAARTGDRGHRSPRQFHVSSSPSKAVPARPTRLS